jgi:hypothetical protein
VRHLEKIARPQQFYLELRRLAWGDPSHGDPDEPPAAGHDEGRTGRQDDRPDEFRTEPLPRLPRLPRGADRFGRRR